MGLLRIARGVLGMAITWAILWTPIAIIPIGMMARFGPPLSVRTVSLLLLSHATTGAINGAAFGLVLAVLGRRKFFDGLSLPWIAACGALGGAILPLVTNSVVATVTSMPLVQIGWSVAVSAVFGAGVASGTLALARRAPQERIEAPPGTAALDAGAV